MTEQPEQEQTVTLPSSRPSFVIPGASVVIQAEEEPMAIEQVLSIVFQVASSNPGCKVGFWLKIFSDQDE
ncbi:hypothetical protein H6G00_05155 [Leptolyngbya sp. FACHB-541]|uniref:hypothetical protein n=1 Tax=Leptolyngbya sp. FACHB-541 TaxID=2692810 RepID=UPI00168343C1|nr:hypothetical protein [Leptolyngbya sp. FACHB-541]MBD1996004.1 hypothetical protein [Leptolyngbya sp. FACHB-541]